MYHSIILYVLVHVNMCIVVCVSMRQRASSLSFRCQVQGRKEEPSSEAPAADKLVDQQQQVFLRRLYFPEIGIIAPPRQPWRVRSFVKQCHKVCRRSSSRGGSPSLEQTGCLLTAAPVAPNRLSRTCPTLLRASVQSEAKLSGG